VAHIPLFVHDPRAPDRAGTRTERLTQSIDLAPTILDLYGLAPPPENEAVSMLAEAAPREALLFGYFCGAVNVTDGRATYHRFPPDLNAQEIYQYTVMPTHIFDMFTPEELAETEMAGPLPFTKGARIMKVPVNVRSPFYNVYGPGALLKDTTRLYNLRRDPGQNSPLADPTREAEMVRHVRRLMQANHAPPEAFARLGLDGTG
jgi:hypothetical protein